MSEYTNDVKNTGSVGGTSYSDSVVSTKDNEVDSYSNSAVIGDYNIGSDFNATTDSTQSASNSTGSSSSFSMSSGTSGSNSGDFGTCRSLEGVECEAANCLYHHPGGQCSATNIVVQAPNADSKTETFCNTFTPNTGY